MAEYRLEDLARESGVSARNIRAYRERGLLDPPRRVGRSALYDDYHLSQLNTISQLLRKGYNSAHIAEFFTSMREGEDLADILGLQRAVLGPDTDEHDNPILPIEPDAPEAHTLIAHGMAEVKGRKLVLTDTDAGEILARSHDHTVYVRTLLRFIEAADISVEELAETFVNSLVELYRTEVGGSYLPKPDEMGRLRQIVEDYRLLAKKVMASRFDLTTRRLMSSSGSDYTAGILLTGVWERPTG
ncbi:MerR family transcriptional regulator [Mycobacterium sp. C3-094]|uniref:MerR family transcriptional regulator n=1 Tax=Mycobacterium sp. PSTR-4-N TaxID=2917745 RepID=UPI001F14FEAA|nr:MerR family transcriptional regulator [Mycobacterium sp. PSTR-4-N]MCG7598111.1 MerR family transcriptional regulator [Mycobacterium sp. PSTR-4-N]